MKITAVLIDDEMNNLDNLHQLLKRHCPEVQVMATALNAEEGRRIILENQPDLVLLDIEMPGKNGFDLLKSLPQYDFEVIFVTAYDQYGIQAVKFSAIDYLLKPINPDELQLAINKVISKNRSKKQNLQLENLLRIFQQQKEDQRIALPTQKETRFIATGDIVRCESSNNYTSFVLANKEMILVSRPIYEYEELLGNYGFFRCHQSHLVNRKYIKSLIREDGGYLLMENGEQIPVSRGKKDFVIGALKNAL
jgi:two-component system, LytTR family, response regulator